MEARTAAGRYSELESSRFIFLARARAASVLTIPSLYPPAGHSSDTQLPTPYQSIGARGVNNLSAKLLLTMFPPNSPFFRYEIGEEALRKATGQDGLKAQVETALAKVEREIQAEFEGEAYRPTLAEVLKHLIVAGNNLLFMKPKGGARYYTLENYVVRRDVGGNVLEIITRDKIARDMLPEEARTTADAADKASGTGTPDPKKDPSAGSQKMHDLYTWIVRGERHWDVHQEVCNTVIIKSKGSYPLDSSPWLPLRWNKIDGEDYGRGYVEEYQGDLQSLEGLTQSIVEGAAGAAKLLVLVNPNGVTKMKTIAEADNGAVRAGREEDVHVIKSDKNNDFSTAEHVIKELKDGLSYAFMLNSAIQRSAERVTAEEIRFMAQELESSLGGLYSILSQELQLPLVKRLMSTMQRAGKLPTLPNKLIKPTIVTGLEALGRGNDLNRLVQFFQTAVAAFGAPIVAQYVNVPDGLSRVAAGCGIDTTGLIKPEAQVQQEQQQMHQQEMAANAAKGAIPPLAASAGKVMEAHASPQAQQPQQAAPADAAT